MPDDWLATGTGDMIDNVNFSPRNRPTTTTHYMSFIRCKFLKCVINVPFSKDDALVVT